VVQEPGGWGYKVSEYQVMRAMAPGYVGRGAVGQASDVVRRPSAGPRTLRLGRFVGGVGREWGAPGWKNGGGGGACYGTMQSSDHTWRAPGWEEREGGVCYGTMGPVCVLVCGGQAHWPPWHLAKGCYSLLCPCCDTQHSWAQQGPRGAVKGPGGDRTRELKAVRWALFATPCQSRQGP